jgi:hypothetical protein
VPTHRRPVERTEEGADHCHQFDVAGAHGAQRIHRQQEQQAQYHAGAGFEQADGAERFAKQAVAGGYGCL